MRHVPTVTSDEDGNIWLVCSCGFTEVHGFNPNLESLWTAYQGHMRRVAGGPAIDVHRQ